MMWRASANISEVWQSLSCFKQGLAGEGVWKSGAALLWVCENGRLLMDGSAVWGKVVVLCRDLNCKLITFPVVANAGGMLCACVSMNFCGKGVRSLKDPLIPWTNHGCAVTQQHKCPVSPFPQKRCHLSAVVICCSHSLNAWWHKDHHPSL